MASPAMILPALGLLGGDGFAGVAAGAASGAEDSALEEHLAAGGGRPAGSRGTLG
ncbi:MAG: hypothetical protein P8075_20095 [Deltaproteobacteria bacterium]|jgi:hypothetical protein